MLEEMSTAGKDEAEEMAEAALKIGSSTSFRTPGLPGRPWSGMHRRRVLPFASHRGPSFAQPSGRTTASLQGARGAEDLRWVWPPPRHPAAPKRDSCSF